MTEQTLHKPLILFDGVCNLCNRSVQFVIRHDPEAIFQFATLQSNLAEKITSYYHLPATDFNSIILFQNGKIYTRSTAALHIARQLKGPVKLLYAFIIVPVFLRDAVYKLVAKKRYQWYGKREHLYGTNPGTVRQIFK